MCKWGTFKKVWVKIPADLSHTGKDHWCFMKIDSCIAPIVKALQEGGIDMRGSCCGHNGGPGRIDLQDGRTLIICQRGPAFNKRISRNLARKKAELKKQT